MAVKLYNQVLIWLFSFLVENMYFKIKIFLTLDAKINLKENLSPYIQWNWNICIKKILSRWDTK